MEQNSLIQSEGNNISNSHVIKHETEVKIQNVSDSISKLQVYIIRNVAQMRKLQE